MCLKVVDTRRRGPRSKIIPSLMEKMNFARIAIVVLSTSYLCLGQSPREIARTAFKSVVILEMNDPNGQPVSLGSGFFIADSIIATNAHVIKGAYSGTAKLVGDTQKLQIAGTVAINYRTDLALLKVSSTAPYLRLGPDTNPVVGDKIYVVGNPLGLEGTFSEGIISGLRAVDADSILQMTAPISPGSSGGPVMDASGTVIGVAEATFSDGQNLNLAVPVVYLSKLWKSASTNISVTSLGQAGQSNQIGKSIVDGVATRTESGVVTSNFKLVYDNPLNRYAGYEFRLTDKLPIAISNIRVRIIYYDASKSVMDFEDIICNQSIPSGLTKTLTAHDSAEAGRAVHYYWAHGKDGSELPTPSSDNSYNAFVPKMESIIELRVIGFRAEGPE